MREMDAEEDITYDVDMLKIRNLKIEWLPFLTYGLVDLAGREPYVKEFTLTQEDLGFCVMSSPVYIFIPRIKRIDFSEALVESVGDRFLHMSGIVQNFSILALESATLNMLWRHFRGLEYQWSTSTPLA